MKPEKKKLPPMPNHLKKLGLYHTEPIRKRLKSFENVIWLAFLRGKQTGKEEIREALPKKKTRIKVKDDYDKIYNDSITGFNQAIDEVNKKLFD